MKPLRHSTFTPLRVEVIPIMESLLFSIYVLFVLFRKGQAICAQPRAQCLSLLKLYLDGI